MGGTTTSYNVPDFLNRSGPAGVNAYGMLSSYTPNALNQYTYVDGATGYDNNFNLTSYAAWGGWTYQYNAENQLTAAGGGYATFVYDALGRCVKRTIGSDVRLIAYDGWKPTVEWTPASNEAAAWNIYGPGADEILWRYVAGVGHLRYHLDRMNNVRFITDVNGNSLEKYTYDPFGWPTVVSWVSGAWDTAHPRTGSYYGNRFMFTGREFFAEMGIMDFRNRWYHPALGRFLQPDPTGFGGGDLNLFRYCGGDPVNRADPTGLLTVSIFNSTGNGSTATTGPVIVMGTAIPGPDPSNGGGNGFSGGFGGLGSIPDISFSSGGQGLFGTPAIYAGFQRLAGPMPKLDLNPLPALPPSPVPSQSSPTPDIPQTVPPSPVAPNPIPPSATPSSPTPSIPPNAGITPFPPNFFYVPTPSPTPAAPGFTNPFFTPTPYPGSYPPIFPGNPPGFYPSLPTPTPTVPSGF